MTITQEAPKLITPREEPLSPLEAQLERAAQIFRWGALANAALAGAGMLTAIIAALAANGLFEVLRGIVLFRYTGRADTALAITLLLALLNVSFMLVAMVGARAREHWTLVITAGIILLNAGLLAVLGYTPSVVAIAFALLGGLSVLRNISAFRANPVMLKELRGRMRGMRAFVVITIYLGLMSGFTALLYLIYSPVRSLTGSSATGELGRVLFGGVVGIELLLIIFIAPAFTAGAITGERERKTYDLLQTTLLPGASFVIGKLESALSYILLLLLAAIPLQSIAFLFGGVSETELFLAFIILAVTAITLGTVGLYFSALADRTLAASVRSYTAALVVTFGAPIVLSIVLGIVRNLLYGGSTVLIASPVVEALLIYADLLLVSINPVATALTTQSQLVNSGDIGFYTQVLSSTGGSIPMISPWILFTILYLIAASVLIVLSIRRMRQVEV